jgi:arsenite methyltransferase
MKPLLLLAVVVTASLIGQVHDQQHARHMDADSYARVLDDPSREAWQKPHEVIQALKFRSNEVVADIGAGTGYFARRFAHHAGTVLAVDIDPKLLAIAGKNAPANLRTVLATPSDPKLAASSVDTVFICNVLHHVDDRPAYLRKLKTVLKPGGRIVILEFHKKALPVGPPPEMKIDEAVLVREFNEASMQVARRHTFLPHQYFLEFEATGPRP